MLWIRGGLNKSYLIWLRTLCISGGYYADRFILVHFLGLEKVGVVTLYFSFTTAILTLVQTGVWSFVYPRLIALYREDDKAKFNHEARQAIIHVALFAGAIAVWLGFLVPLLGHLLNKPEFTENAPVLWLLVAGMWVRANAETLYQVLFARHQDRAIWLGNILYLLPALLCNAVFVALLGFIGVGYGAIVSILFILMWRAWYVWGKPPVSPKTGKTERGKTYS